MRPTFATYATKMKSASGFSLNQVDVSIRLYWFSLKLWMIKWGEMEKNRRKKWMRRKKMHSLCGMRAANHFSRHSQKNAIEWQIENEREFHWGNHQTHQTHRAKLASSNYSNKNASAISPIEENMNGKYYFLFFPLFFLETHHFASCWHDW